MAKKIIGYGDYFCVFCGDRVETKTDRCPKCGKPYGDAKFYGMNAFGAGGIGWSDRAKDPTFRKNKKKNAFGSIVFCLIVSFIIWLVMYFEGGAGFEDDGERTYWIIMAILWTFWLLWIIITYSKSKVWDGIVEKKDIKHNVSTERDDNGRTYTRESTSFIINFRLTNGKRKKHVDINNSLWFDYLKEGDMVRCHGDKMGYFEKYDKSHDSEIPCASCGSRRDAREIYCGRCGAVILKGNAVQMQQNTGVTEMPNPLTNNVHHQNVGTGSASVQTVSNNDTHRENSPVKFCPECGCKADGGKFCRECGHKLIN